MVETTNPDSTQQPALAEVGERRALVIGALGAGKSTIMSILASPELNAFESSSSLTGCTKGFEPYQSTQMNCTLIDSPGLCDPNIPINQWLNIYNGVYQTLPVVDLVLVIIERRTRVDTATKQVFTVLDTILKGIEPDNIAVIMNKCAPKDTTAKVKKFYAQAKKESSAENLPDLETEDQLLCVQMRDEAESDQEEEEIRANQKIMMTDMRDEVLQFAFRILANCQSKIATKETQVQEIADKVKDPLLLEQLEQQQKEFEKQRAMFEEQAAAAEKRFQEAEKRRADDLQAERERLKSQYKDLQRDLDKERARNDIGCGPIMSIYNGKRYHGFAWEGYKFFVYRSGGLPTPAQDTYLDPHQFCKNCSYVENRGNHDAYQCHGHPL